MKVLYLSGAIELEQQACLAGKQVLPEVELRNAVAAHHAAASLTPGSLQDLGNIITIRLASCNTTLDLSCSVCEGPKH